MRSMLGCGGVVVLAAALAGCGMKPEAKAIAIAPKALATDGAELCYAKFLAGVNAIGRDLPALSASAEAAAKQFVQEDYGIGAAGDRAVVQEMFGRCGGLMTLEDLHVPPEGAWKGIVLYAVRDGSADEDAFFIRYYRAQGDTVILCGRADLLSKLKAKGIDVAGAIDNHAPGGGLLTIERRFVVPLDQGLDAAALWTWTGEFVAACTRLGKMPTMYKGYVFPGGEERAQKIGKAKFHEGRPEAVAAGVLGAAYLKSVRETMALFHERELGHIHEVAELAIKARDAHHGVYAYIESHLFVWQFEEPHESGVFTKIGWWHSLRQDVKLEPGDFVLGLGYADLFEKASYDSFAEKARKAGVKIAWAIGGFGDTRPAIAPGELFIDQQWKADDAVVEVPGYDIRILPTSGVMQEVVFQMACADVLSRRPDQWVVKK